MHSTGAAGGNPPNQQLSIAFEWYDLVQRFDWILGFPFRFIVFIVNSYGYCYDDAFDRQWQQQQQQQLHRRLMN